MYRHDIVANMATSKGRRKHKVCNKCGEHNALNARQCKSCKSQRFAPNWVMEMQPINRQASVQVTKPNPEYGQADPRITLSKWWPGGRATYHIPNAAQWQVIEETISGRFAPLLGWKGTEEILTDIREKKDQAESSDYEQLIDSHPDFLKKLVAAVDPQRVGSQELSKVVETFGEISDALTNANAGFREAFLAVIQKLPKQKQRALEDLDLLLQGWSLHVVTNVAQQVRARVETIELFRNQVEDPRTFEITGDNSIHRILERSMWLVDERYWLLQSNGTLRKFIGDQLSKEDKKKYGKKRPDFVCGTFGNRLIILELKRPSHSLTVDDLNQLEKYTVIAEDYSNFTGYEAYLVGAKKDPELDRYLKRRSSSFRTMMYADMLDATEKRYAEFLQTLE